MNKLQILYYSYVISKKSYKSTLRIYKILKDWFENPSKEGQVEAPNYYALIAGAGEHIPLPMTNQRIANLYTDRCNEYGFVDRVFNCPICGAESYFSFHNRWCRACGTAYKNGVPKVNFWEPDRWDYSEWETTGEVFLLENEE